MIIASYGAGTNSTAMLIEWVRLGNQLDLVLFADTGGERPETYCHMREFSVWMVARGYPEITIVSEKETLEDDCLRRGALPGLAYGFKSCSEHYKIRPQKRHLKALGIKAKDCTFLVGIDADEPQRARDDANTVYPLLEWDWGRDECIEAIKREGISLPGKSSCFFCPSMRPSEIRALAAKHPELAERALAMEANADLTSIKGLGRNWAWRDLLATNDMFGDESYEIEIACGCYDG